MLAICVTLFRKLNFSYDFARISLVKFLQARAFGILDVLADRSPLSVYQSPIDISASRVIASRVDDLHQSFLFEFFYPATISFISDIHRNSPFFANIISFSRATVKETRRDKGYYIRKIAFFQGNAKNLQKSSKNATFARYLYHSSYIIAIVEKTTKIFYSRRMNL